MSIVFLMLRIQEYIDFEKTVYTVTLVQRRDMKMIKINVMKEILLKYFQNQETGNIDKSVFPPISFSCRGSQIKYRAEGNHYMLSCISCFSSFLK